MGDAYKLKCEHCSFKQNVFLGFGFHHVDLENISTSIKDASIQARIAKFLKDKSARYDAFEALYTCQKCNYLLNDLYLAIQSDTDSFTITYDCPRCSDPLLFEPDSKLSNQATMLDMPECVLACPECRKEKLTFSYFMEWD